MLFFALLKLPLDIRSQEGPSGFGKVLDKSLRRLLAACLVGLSARICTAETPQTKCTMRLLSRQSQPNSQLETEGYDGKFVMCIGTSEKEKQVQHD